MYTLCTVLDMGKSKDKNRDKVLDEAGSHFAVHNKQILPYRKVVHKRRYVTNRR